MLSSRKNLIIFFPLLCSSGRICRYYTAAAWALAATTSTRVGHILPTSSRTTTTAAKARQTDSNNDDDDSEPNFEDSWSIITLGDLHMEDDMTFHEQARRDCLYALQDFPILGSFNNKNIILSEKYLQDLLQTKALDLSIKEMKLLLQRKQQGPFLKTHLVSLGDLGRQDRDAGTTNCFERAKQYFDGFVRPNQQQHFKNEQGIPEYDLVTGNHDLEGLQEFQTDKENLQAWMDCFGKTTPQFARYLGQRTLLLGLSTVRFREAPYSPHEVHVDPEQIKWFQDMVTAHSHKDGWKILVFSHAPIIGSGLRVIQKVHVSSGCAWINHSSKPDERNSFIRIVKQNPQIKWWASGHFHLSHEYQDSMVQIGSCTFVQVGVMGRLSCRDGKRQSRFFRGCGNDRIEIYSINHHVRCPIVIANDSHNDNHNNDEDTLWKETKAEVRLDAIIDLKTDKLTLHQDDKHAILPADSNDNEKQESWFRAYLPQEQDGCYLDDFDGNNTVGNHQVCWWHMADGKVLGLHQGQVIEYDAETLAPLGVVVREDQLNDREVMLLQNKTALVLVNDTAQSIQVVHPNSDGSYWRKFQSKRIRVEEKALEEISVRWKRNSKH